MQAAFPIDWACNPQVQKYLGVVFFTSFALSAFVNDYELGDIFVW